MKYYVGADGRAVQGVHAIDGKAYDFGTNGTFNLKGKRFGLLAGYGWPLVLVR